MKVFYSERHRSHDPQRFISRGKIVPCPEQPARAERMLDALRGEDHQIEEPREFGFDPLATVHASDYLHFLQHGYDAWRALDGAAEEMLPNVHPARSPASRPSHIVGQAGYYQADTACPIAAGTWEAAVSAADAALCAADEVRAGARHAYALCRPPGHHAFADMAGGFCYINNAALAGEHLIRSGAGRVAILDVDVHHGNGTQSIFYHRGDVYFASIHVDPAVYYPFFWGYAHERGEGDGAGCNANYPCPPGTGDGDYLEVLAQALDGVASFAPDGLVLSLGLDTQADDPLGQMAISGHGFERMGATIAELGLATVLVQEGGYLSPSLGTNLVSFLRGFEAKHR